MESNTSYPVWDKKWFISAPKEDILSLKVRSAQLEMARLWATENKSLEEIAKMYSVTRERVRQCISKVLAMLRVRSLRREGIEHHSPITEEEFNQILDGTWHKDK